MSHKASLFGNLFVAPRPFNFFRQVLAPSRQFVPSKTSETNVHKINVCLDNNQMLPFFLRGISPELRFTVIFNCHFHISQISDELRQILTSIPRVRTNEGLKKVLDDLWVCLSPDIRLIFINFNLKLSSSQLVIPHLLFRSRDFVGVRVRS